MNDNEIEHWVVKAITAKLLDCKMDQMNRVVIVRYVYESFCLLDFISWLLFLLAYVTFSFFLLFSWHTYLISVCSRCTERMFGPQQWEQLRSKLAIWRVRLQNINFFLI